MSDWPEPAAANGYLCAHAARLLDSYRHWTGMRLFDPLATPEATAQALFAAPFVVVSHDTRDDPILNYGNRTAMRLWEMSWADLTRTPSRQTAEAGSRQSRDELMRQVREQGFSSGYRGVRISSAGRRFRIDDATVWNVLDGDGSLCGQAATFARWTYL